MALVQAMKVFRDRMIMNSAPSSNPDITVIIPVFNAIETLENLVTDFLDIEDTKVQLLLVDDCSTDGSNALIRDLEAKHVEVKGHYLKSNSGAGVARNAAFTQASGEFTLFFDADDIVHKGAVTEAIDGLRKTGADLAMTPYFYRRDVDSDHTVMNHHDAKIWNDVTKGQDQFCVALEDAAALLGFSNYPWNKLLRTSHYKEVGLRFGSTAVNNDILGHWYALLFSRNILLLSTEMCTHIVLSSGSNLTNRHSRVRLNLFDALDETYDLLESNTYLRSRYAHHYWSLAVRTTRWARSRISEDMTTEFNIRFQEHLSRINLEDFSRMRQKRSPRLADDLLRMSLV